MKRTYLNNLKSSMAKANVKSLKNKCAKSFDNKKIKTAKRMLPRGNAFKRMEKIERQEWFDRISGSLYKSVDAMYGKQ